MDIPAILSRKYAGTEWTLDGDDYTGLTWLSDGDAPTEAQLAKLWPTVQAEIEAEKQAVIDARLSAISKLEALGLTVDEVQAAFGLSANV
jgi:hypothetical protein